MFNATCLSLLLPSFVPFAKPEYLVESTEYVENTGTVLHQEKRGMLFIYAKQNTWISMLDPVMSLIPSITYDHSISELKCSNDMGTSKKVNFGTNSPYTEVRHESL